MIYFDHNATSPLLPEARKIWLEATEKYFGNPSSPHRVGSRAEVALSEARDTLAKILRCDALDIVWTSGATESNNMALRHYAASLDPETEVWVSAIEHPCVQEPARHCCGKRLRFIPANRAGAIDLNWMQDRLRRKRPGLIAVMAANNETGVLQPWREILGLCQANKVPFFCDATQWIGKLPAEGLGVCDFVSGSAHKFGGPRGVGFLKCPGHGRVVPLLFGGQQEEGRRAGTENVAGVLAMLAALKSREAALARGEAQARRRWREHFERFLDEALPGSDLVGAQTERLWNTVSALMPAVAGPQRWVVKLDKLGCAVSTGSACASGTEEPSHVLVAMGYAPAEAGRVLRFSSGWETTESEWISLSDALLNVYRGLRAVPGQERAFPVQGGRHRV